MLRVSHAAHNLRDAVVILICAASNKHQSQLPAGLCQQDGDVPAGLAQPVAAASVPAEVGSLSACLNRMLRVGHSANQLLEVVVIPACAVSKTKQSQLPCGLCQQVGDMPAALAEPDVTASVPAEVGSLYVCLSRMLRVSHTAQEAMSQPDCKSIVRVSRSGFLGVSIEE